MRIRNANEKNQSSPAKTIKTVEPSKRLVTDFLEWRGPEEEKTIEYIDLIDSLASGATVATAITRIGIAPRTFAKWMHAEGEPFDSFRNDVQKAIANSAMYAEQKLQEKNPLAYLKMVGKYIPFHPINDPEPEKDVSNAGQPKQIDYTKHQNQFDSLMSKFITRKDTDGNSPPVGET